MCGESSSPTVGQRQERYPGFLSFKSLEPIVYPRRWLRSALIQAALDPTVVVLKRSRIPLEELPEPVEFAFEGVISNSTFLFAVGEGRSPALHDAWRGRVLWLTRSEILNGPGALAAKEIWSRKRFCVMPADRFRALVTLLQLGGEATAGSIVPHLLDSHIEPVDQLMALLANGHLAADISCGFTPETKIRLGPLSQRTPPALHVPADWSLQA
jgi:hypothetical protein